MIDFAIDGDFNFFLNNSGQYATVNGIEEFEQSVGLMVTEYMQKNVIGESDEETIKNKIRLQVSRVAQDHDRLEDIYGIDISEHPDKPNSYVVTINYEFNSQFQFTISE